MYNRKIKIDQYPLITIVILNYNGEKYLQITLPQLSKLTYPNIEIIIVDNGSKDRSIIFLEQQENITLIKNSTNLGYSAGKNQGIKAAKGEYVFLLDEDIFIDDLDLLQILLENYKANTGFIQPLLVDKDKDVTTYYGIYPSIYGVNLHRKAVQVEKILQYDKALIEVEGGTGGCLFFKRSIWNKLGGYDESQLFNIDDIDIGPRAILYGYRNYLLTKRKVTHLGVNNFNIKEKLNYSNRFRYLFSGHARSIVKNYKSINLVPRIFVLFFYVWFKAILYSIKRRDITIIFANIYSIVRFFKNLPSTLKERHFIQNKRIINEDNFLKISIPKFGN